MNAARELVEQGGYPAATIEAIAARSRVAKTTIYRWWPNRAALVVELLVQVAAAVAPPLPETGDPMRALRADLRRVAEASEGLAGRLLISLLGEAEHDAHIHDALMQGLFHPRGKATARAIRRAQGSGALRRDVPPLVARDLLYGPLFYRKFIRREPVNRGFVDEVFRHFVAGLRPHGGPPRSR